MKGKPNRPKAPTKNRPTPRQIEALKRQKEWGSDLRESMQQPLAKTEPKEVTPSGHGVTRILQSITGRSPEFVHRHAFTAGWHRRFKREEDGSVTRRSVPLWSGNEPYINPARDLKPGARLRKDR